MKISYSFKFEDKSGEFLKSLSKEFGKAMHEMEADAKRLAPVDTGRLRNSIYLNKVTDYHYVMRDGVEYGVFNEFGTNKMTPNPFFRPAARMAKEKIKGFFR